MDDDARWLSLKLGRYDTISSEEAEVIASLPDRTRQIERGEDMVTEGSRPLFSTLLVDGLCARYSLLEDGKRQISALHVPGDFVDLHSFLIKTMDHSVMALSPCTIVEVPHTSLARVTRDHPHLTRLLWLSTLVDAAIHRKWLVAMGAMNAQARMAHLVCEMYVRLETVGLARELRLEFPLTQSELADTLGLSIVHTNRMLQELRGSGLVKWSGGTVEILDWPQLQKLAMYDATYLSLRKEPR
jgi:CRP-like cAMP-binding protein